jgi:hypothetical protein
VERGPNSRLRSGWKWAVAVILVGVAGALWWWPTPPGKIELLPFSTTPPVWDGSQAWLIISPVAGSTPLKFKTEIAMVKPSVRHESPVNEFVVNQFNGAEIVRTTVTLPSGEKKEFFFHDGILTDRK